MTTWKDRVYSRIPQDAIESRILWHAQRIADQTQWDAKMPLRQRGDESYQRAIRIVRSEDAGQGVPIDETYE